MLLRSLIISSLLINSFSLFAFAEKYRDWFNLDPSIEKVEGVSADKLHSLIKVPYRRMDIVVAVIDSGVDIRHPDLRGKIWVNKKEIPGNGIDDDKNGYIDDIYGWNYLGGKDGRNINNENLEFTRQFRRYSILKSKRALSSKESHIYNQLAAMLKKETISAKQSLQYYKSIGDADGVAYFQDMLRFYLNPKFNPRPQIVKDNPMKLREFGYGNNNVQGPDASHGTHVAGIIAAVRNNGLGMNGVASRVKIMSLRAVPNGDEYDKDVANAIRYAADNGARIINMSFGKSISPYKAYVDQAVKYALSKGVLLFHAAGNDGKSNDDPKTPSFPNKFTKRGEVHKNYIQVGASRSIKRIQKPVNIMGAAGVQRKLQINSRATLTKFGKTFRSVTNGAQGKLTGLAAGFSNYGIKNVDLFAPGVNIYSTIPGGKYDSYNGTSMATPVAAGVAALILSIKPDLSPVQLKHILKKSVVNHRKLLVIRPGSQQKVAFGLLSETGGVINAVRAARLLGL